MTFAAKVPEAELVGIEQTSGYAVVVVETDAGLDLGRIEHRFLLDFS